MRTIEDKIKEFAENPDNVRAALALLKVGHDKGETRRAVTILLADALFRFHGIPFKSNG